jgi:hypothetical protein
VAINKRLLARGAVTGRESQLSATDTSLSADRKEVSRAMKKKELTVADLALLAGTRGMLGAGVGLLLSSKLTKDQRRAAGWALVTVGAVTTVPLLMTVFGNHR